MAQNKPRYVSTFRAPTEYERQLEEARRRAALAEALAQQEYQPMEGTAAPIPKAAPLVKALQGYLTAREGRMAKEAATEAEKAGRKEFTDYIRSFEPEQQTVGMGQIAAMEATAPQIDAQGRVTYNPPSAVAAPNQRLVATSLDQPMQMQVGGPLTTAQKRARALEGFESTNPMVQQFAMAQYEKTMPKEVDLKLAPINPADIDMASFAEAQRTGDVSKIKPRTKAPDLPSDVQSYQYYVQQETTSGRTPRTFEQWKMSQRPQTTVSIPTARDLQQDESRLRDQLEGRLNKMDWAGTQSAMQRILSAPDTPIGDVDIVYAAAKAADSSGAVRKEDFDLRAKDGSLGGQIKSWYEEAKSGRMLPARRQQIVDSAIQFYQAREASVNKLLKDYEGIAGRSGLNVENVIAPFRPTPLWSDDDEKELQQLRKKAAGNK